MGVLRRQPENPLGWLFLIIAVFMPLSTAGGDYGYLGYRLGHHLPLASAGLALAAFWGISLALLGVAVALFPDGRLPTRFWRVALRIYWAVFAILILATYVAIGGALSAHPVRVDSSAGLTAVDHPGGWYGAIQGPSALATVVLSLAFIARQALSWRRAAGDRRQQLKWLASGAAVSIVSLVLATSFSTPGRGPAQAPLTREPRLGAGATAPAIASSAAGTAGWTSGCTRRCRWSAGSRRGSHPSSAGSGHASVLHAGP